MRLKTVSQDSLDDGWTEPVLPFRAKPAAFPAASEPGDTVLYRIDGKLTPAVLVDSMGDDCWLARDARHTHSLIYLEAKDIVTRLPRMDLLEEAA